jgi:hypothetical protein
MAWPAGWTEGLAEDACQRSGERRELQELR